MRAPASSSAAAAGGGGGGGKRPPTSVTCVACGHDRHPRSATCRDARCDCACRDVAGNVGAKKRRRQIAVANADGEWRAATHRKVIAHAKRAAETMRKCAATYCVLSARRGPNGEVITDVWGSHDWVERELAGKSSNVVELVWRSKTAEHLTEESVAGLSEYAPVFAALKRFGLTHLRGAFLMHNVDAAAFASPRLDDDALRRVLYTGPHTTASAW